MFKYNLTLLTNWIGDGTQDNPNRPAVIDDYRLECGVWSDVTSGVPHPDPDLYVLRVPVTQAGFDAIEADPNYQVLSSEERINEL